MTPSISDLFRLRQLCLMLIICASLSACGIRPGQLERPPSEPGEVTYPQTYPAPSTLD